MLTIGGYTAESDANLGTMSNDTFLQGLGIFDLTEMQWKDKYDADAPPYESPDVVKAWYRANGTATQDWDDPDVQKLFEKVSTTTPSATAGTASESPSSTLSPSESSTPQSHTSHTGAIAGGVVGGVAAAGLLATLIFLLLRRKSRNQGSYAAADRDRGMHSELPTHQEKRGPQELPETYRPMEMDAAHPTMEMEARGPSYLQNLKSIPSV